MNITREHNASALQCAHDVHSTHLRDRIIAKRFLLLDHGVDGLSGRALERSRRRRLDALGAEAGSVVAVIARREDSGGGEEVGERQEFHLDEPMNCEGICRSNGYERRCRQLPMVGRWPSLSCPKSQCLTT